MLKQLSSRLQLQSIIRPTVLSKYFFSSNKRLYQESSKHDQVKDYYSNLLKDQSTLLTNTCVVDDCSISEEKSLKSKIHPDILAKSFGCGSPIPPMLQGKTVVDLGSGAGGDVYVCSALVGNSGRVIGVDMTQEMIDFASRYKDYHKKIFGLESDVVEFRKGVIEDLNSVNLESESVDVVISNCVINLSPDKQRVLNEIYRVLKHGGELYFSDVFTDRRVPQHLQDDRVLWGECLSGAMYIGDFKRMMQKAGFPEYRVVTKSEIGGLQKVRERLKERGERLNVRFYSVTVRSFKLDTLEDAQEDYGETATLVGQDQFTLDWYNQFEKGEPKRVSGNTAEILRKTRFSSLFEVSARKQHSGVFKVMDNHEMIVSRRPKATCATPTI